MKRFAMCIFLVATWIGAICGQTPQTPSGAHPVADGPSAVATDLLAAIHREDGDAIAKFLVGNDDLKHRQAKFFLRHYTGIRKLNPDNRFRVLFSVVDDELAVVGIGYDREPDNVEIDALPMLRQAEKWLAFLPTPEFGELREQLDQNQQSRFARLMKEQFSVKYRELSQEAAEKMQASAEVHLDPIPENLHGTWLAILEDGVLALKLQEDIPAVFGKLAHGKVDWTLSGRWKVEGQSIAITLSDNKVLQLSLKTLQRGYLIVEGVLPSESTASRIEFERVPPSSFEVIEAKLRGE